jgi:hypothetical protein
MTVAALKHQPEEVQIPSSEIQDVEGRCHLCSKEEYHDRAGDAFIVQECRKCERPTCQDCAETNYDMQGDPPTCVCTQWSCETCLNNDTVNQ